MVSVPYARPGFFHNEKRLAGQLDSGLLRPFCASIHCRKLCHISMTPSEFLIDGQRYPFYGYTWLRPRPKPGNRAGDRSDPSRSIGKPSTCEKSNRYSNFKWKPMVMEFPMGHGAGARKRGKKLSGNVHWVGRFLIQADWKRPFRSRGHLRFP